MRLIRLACWVLSIALLPAAVLAQPASDIPVLHYKLAPAWPKGPVNDKGFTGIWSFWQVPGLAVEPNGHVLLLHRGAYPILEFTADGDFIGPWGNVNFSEGRDGRYDPSKRTPAMSAFGAVYGPGGCTNCGAHTIRVDPEGNVWVVDSTGDVITKLDLKGHVLMTLGTRGKAGQTHDTFYLPNDIAFAPNGELVVSDGYGNARVVRFSHDGKYLGEFGTRGTGPGQFELPHCIVIDRQGHIYVSDRDDRRVEVFDAKGKYLSEWDEVGGLSSLLITPDQHIWAGNVLRDLNGKAIERLPSKGPANGAHGAALAPNGDIYAGLLDGTVEKFVAAP